VQIVRICAAMGLPEPVAAEIRQAVRWAVDRTWQRYVTPTDTSGLLIDAGLERFYCGCSRQRIGLSDE